MSKNVSLYIKNIDHGFKNKNSYDIIVIMSGNYQQKI